MAKMRIGHRCTTYRNRGMAAGVPAIVVAYSPGPWAKGLGPQRDWACVPALPRGEELLTTVVGSTAGAGFLEAAVLHLSWDTDQAVNLMNAFVLCNVLVLVLAVLMGAISIMRTLPRRLSSAALPTRRLYGPGHGVGDMR